MISPDTERKPLTFFPCPICGEIEREVTAGVYRIDHDFSKHPGLAERPRQRLTTSELMALPEIDWSMIR